MIFVAILYSEFELKEKIELDSTKSIEPLGWEGFREVEKDRWGMGNFKFAYIEKDVDKPSKENIRLENTKIKSFLEFFSFITGNGWSIQEFEERGGDLKYFSLKEEVEVFLAGQTENETKDNPPVIESNFFIQYLYRTKIGEIKFSKAWELFLSKEEKYRDMVSVYCARLVGSSNSIYEVFNKDTVNLFLLIALIEGLLPRRRYCEKKFACTSCDTQNNQHYPESTYEYWPTELDNKLCFSDNLEYIELIVSIHKDIRNSFAHTASLLPELEISSSYQAQGPHTRFMFLNDVIKLRDSDRLARSNALLHMRDIVWFLLISEFFPENINKPWPNLGLLKEVHSG